MNKQLKEIIAKILSEDLFENIISFDEALSCINENKDIIKYGEFSINFYRIKALINLKTKG